MHTLSGRDVHRSYAMRAFTIALLLITSTVRAEVPWILDLDEGLRQARMSGKDVMLVFTGRGWCGHCMILEREVFKKPEFIRAVGNQYVFVELDFTFGDSEQEQAREKRLRRLADERLISGYPTVTLIDPTSEPYAYFVGYDPGLGVDRYLGRISAAREAHQRFANAADGGKQPAAFTEALASVAEFFDAEEGRDDPFFKYYVEEVEQVLAAVPASDKNRVAIAHRHAAQTTRDQRESIWRPIADQLSELSDREDWQGLVEFIKKTLPAIEDSYLRDQLERQLLRPYEKLEDYESALEVVQRLRSKGDSENETQRRLINSEARMLRLLDRGDEAIALYNKEIKAAREVGLTDYSQWLLGWKLQHVVQSKRFKEAIEVAEECRQSAVNGSEEWLTATYIKSLALRKTGRFREALHMSTEQYEADPQPYAMVDIAECYFGNGDEANGAVWIDKAQKEAERLRESPRSGDRCMAKDITERIKSVRREQETTD